MSHPWNTVSLGELTSNTRPICYGVLKPGPYVPDGVPLLRIVDLAQNRVNTTDVHRISAELDDEFSRSKLNGGEVLLSIQGTVGRVAICPATLAGANISRTLAVIEPDSRVLAEFLRYYLLFVTARRAFQTRGTTRASLNISTIRAMRIPAPTIEEQRHVVDVLETHLSRLDVADAAVAGSVKRLTFMRAAELARLWVVSAETGSRRSVSEIGTVVTGSTPATRDGDAFGGDTPFLTPSDIRQGQQVVTWGRTLNDFGARASRLLPTGAVVAVCIGATLGKVGWADRLIATNQQINAVVVSPDTARPEVVAALMAAPQFQQQMLSAASSTTIPILNKSKLSRLSLPIAPLHTQDELIRRLQETDLARARLSAAASTVARRSDTLRRALLEAAFAGRLSSPAVPQRGIQELSVV